MNKNIIAGYNGIMPLDLTNIDKKYHKDLISEHKKNIEEYNLEHIILTIVSSDRSNNFLTQL